MKALNYAGIVLLVVLLSGGVGQLLAQEEQMETMDKKAGKTEFTISSEAFGQGDPIPEKYACNGQDISPALSWQNVPEGTKSLALICDDPDAPKQTWIHWVIYNIPTEADMLPEDVSKDKKVLEGPLAGTIQGVNSWKKTGYGGPCPPEREEHRYFFKLYALDTKITEKGLDKDGLLSAMEGHILGTAKLMGRYQK